MSVQHALPCALRQVVGPCGTVTLPGVERPDTVPWPDLTPAIMWRARHRAGSIFEPGPLGTADVRRTPIQRAEGAARWCRQAAAGLACRGARVLAAVAVGAWLAAGGLGSGGLGWAAPAWAGQDPPAGSANDLFKALAAPDRQADLESLRAIQRDLAAAPDAGAVAAARTALATLLADEERRQADQAPALVMSRLAARIDGAIAGLEQTTHRPPVTPGADGVAWQPMASAALGAFTGFAAALVTGLAALGMGRRGLLGPLHAALDGMEAAGARLSGAATMASRAQESTAEAASAAADAARDATLAVARLNGAALDAQNRLRAYLEEASAGQDQAAALAGALAADCTRLSGALPDMVERAAAALAAHGCAAADAVAARQADGARALQDAASALRDEAAAAGRVQAARMADAAVAAQAHVAAIEIVASQLHDGADSVVRAASSLRDEASQAVRTQADTAASLLHAHAVATIDTVADRLAGSAGVIETAADALRGQTAMFANAGTAHMAAAQLCREKATDLARQCTRLGDRLPEIFATAIVALEARGRAAIEATAGRLDDVTSGVEAASAAVQQVATAMEQAGHAQIEAGSVSLAQCAELGQSGLQLAAQARSLLDESVAGLAAAARSTIGSIAERLQDSTLNIEAAAATLHDGAAAISTAAQIAAAGDPAAAAPVGETCAGETATGRAVIPQDVTTGQQAGGAAPAAPESLALFPTHAVAQIEAAAARLAARAEAHDAAAARVARAALEVAEAAAPGGMAASDTGVPTLARLSVLAAETEALFASAATMAEAALGRDAGAVPPDAVEDAPALLAAIAVSIEHLRGTATALAAATDAARIAA